jgi:hypothetical protein
MLYVRNPPRSRPAAESAGKTVPEDDTANDQVPQGSVLDASSRGTVKWRVGFEEWGASRVC